MRNIQVGQTVASGQSLLSIAPTDKIFVTANYKETQIGSIHAGQRVQISVDGCRGAKLAGIVKGLGPVAQSSLSTLPTTIGPCTLRPGMSVETSVLMR